MQEVQKEMVEWEMDRNMQNEVYKVAQFLLRNVHLKKLTLNLTTRNFLLIRILFKRITNLKKDES